MLVDAEADVGSLVEEAIQQNAHFRSRKGRANRRVCSAANARCSWASCAELELVRFLPARGSRFAAATPMTSRCRCDFRPPILVFLRATRKVTLVDP